VELAGVTLRRDGNTFIIWIYICPANSPSFPVPPKASTSPPALRAKAQKVIVSGRSEKSANVVLAKIRQTIPDAKLEGFTGNLSDAIIVDKLVKQFYGCTIR
jgi:hypothetical protein